MGMKYQIQTGVLLLIEHALIPETLFAPSNLCGEHKDWIKNWLDELDKEISNDILSSSNCIAGFISECVIHGSPRTDWLGLMKDLLEENGVPLAYSEEFGKKLYKFNQWKQTPVHAIYGRWWIEKNLGRKNSQWATFITKLIQPNGWIYNPQVSPTNIRTRMQAELFMSFSMGSEILLDSNMVTDKSKFASVIISKPLTNYVSSEYFRFRSLRSLSMTAQMVVGVDNVIQKCKTNPGFADFSVTDKIDDYMGVAKRASRDVAIFSPISTLHALNLAENCGIDQAKIDQWLEEIKTHLKKDPLNIPSLHMRDLDAKFGEGRTIYEIVAAAQLMEK